MLRRARMSVGMTLISSALAPLDPRTGLAARAIALTIALSIIGCMIAFATVTYGVQRESERHQLVSARDLNQYLAHRMVDWMADGKERPVNSLVRHMLDRAGMRRMAVMAEDGRIVAEHGGAAEDAAASVRAGQEAIRAQAGARVRLADGALAVATPIVHDGRILGASVIVVEPNAFRFDVLLALTPFFLFIGCFLLAAVPLISHWVRRTVAPLDQLTQLAERVATHGEAAPIFIRTGDEFETLANAFNHMIARLDASMRKIQQIAFVDPVTQLPNQDRFQREVDFFILQAGQGKTGGAVMVFELQRLPRLMQTLDPDSAREFMRVVAERFTMATRHVDRLTRLSGAYERPAVTARLGVNDLAVLAPDLASPADAARFAQQLCAALNQPFNWREHTLQLGAACGAALVPRDGRDADSVIRHARMALAAAQTAPSRLKIFTQSLDREAVARATLEREMRGALDRNEFRAFFQPKINLATGKVEACEALARWVREDRTIVSPGRFIPVAEESGLIGPLSDAIMREACWKAAAWRRAGTPVKVAVNISALQFRDDRFAEHVLQVANHAGLPPSYLELEITESVVMEDPERALRLINPLRAAGVRLAIDDFGCGHSSLAALSKLPFDVIKIDQQFIRALERGDAQAAAIIEMILALAGALNLEVVAEGVERREHVDFMAARGCHWIQGFVYGAAVSAQEFTEMLRAQTRFPMAAENAA
jgi:EAL domain-containing protein (putative c-di-GMP-specific phosphodiesterase class I)/GGDEF domain-containing protein